MKMKCPLKRGELLASAWNPKQPLKKWMFGETTISYVKIGNHPIETTIYKWLFGVPGGSVSPPEASRSRSSVLKVHNSMTS